MRFIALLIASVAACTNGTLPDAPQPQTCFHDPNEGPGYYDGVSVHVDAVDSNPTTGPCAGFVGSVLTLADGHVIGFDAMLEAPLADLAGQDAIVSAPTYFAYSGSTANFAVTDARGQLRVRYFEASGLVEVNGVRLDPEGETYAAHHGGCGTTKARRLIVRSDDTEAHHLVSGESTEAGGYRVTSYGNFQFDATNNCSDAYDHISSWAAIVALDVGSAR